MLRNLFLLYLYTVIISVILVFIFTLIVNTSLKCRKRVERRLIEHKEGRKSSLLGKTGMYVFVPVINIVVSVILFLWVVTD